MKFISPLTEDQAILLEDIMKHDSSSRVRIRAHSVILSGRGYKTDEIADIYRLDRDTVSSCIDLWEKFNTEGLPLLFLITDSEASGINRYESLPRIYDTRRGFGSEPLRKMIIIALSDKPRSGRPPKLTEDEKEIAKKLIRKYPRSVKAVIAELAEITGKVVSVWTIKRLAGAVGTWRRIRRSLKSKRDEKKFEKAKEEIQEHKQQQQAGEIDLFYSDETGFDLQPSVPYAWQPKDENIEVPASRSPRLSVLGFLNTATGEFHSFTFEGSINSDIVVACFDWFSDIISKKTIVIMDNSPTHTSDLFAENIEIWEEKGLFIMNIPPYSPELNLIEILWRFIKYLWLPFSAYLSFKDLVNEVEKILKGIGSEYQINFS
ncbi:MAG: IS630 family transposase [Desulfobacteraceae bacterium]|nr:IS630 family transposase [Desulfobacteraceae bacterium]